MKNKTLIFLLLSLLCDASFAFAQSHLVEVQRFENWGHDYLTVTNNWNGVFLQIESGQLPMTMSVITSVNGMSTVDMSEEEFYKVIDSSNNIQLSYLQKIKGKNQSQTVSFKPKGNYYVLGGIQKVQPIKINDISLFADTDIDFFELNTYDYFIDGDDKLADKSLLDEISRVFENRGMKRDKENPDILFKIKKSLSQSTNATYVPEKWQVVPNASVTTLNYSSLIGQNYLLNRVVSNTIYRSDSYTHTGVNATFHLEFTVIKNEPGKDKTECAVIWKLDYNYFSATPIDVVEEVRHGVSYWCLNYPFSTPIFSYSAISTGLVFESPNTVGTGEVIDVLPGTFSYEMGMRGGDKILKATRNYVSWVCVGRSHYNIFKADSNRKRFITFPMLGYFILCPIPIPWPKKNLGYNNSSDYLFYVNTVGRFFGAKPITKYKIRRGNGSEYTIKVAGAGFFASRYNYLAQGGNIYYEYIY